ncbi:MAG: ketoacyl-ACP synthase III [Deltaproteobacteria bacterium]|nr:ketoacyl-ACP synthase III [Deltaproteobacteria bacterium]
MVPIRVAGTGYYVPDKILHNLDLEKTLDTSDEWIYKRTGIRERRISRPDQAASDLALPAARQALANAGLSDRDLDLIVMATITPDMCCPCGANVLQGKLDAPQAVSFDVSAACSGFIFVLDVASRYLQSGAANTVLVTASEVMSRVQDWTDRANCVLWGDGAGAVVLTRGEGRPALLDTYIGTDGVNGQDLLVPGAGSATTPITHETVDSHLHTLKMINASQSVRVAVKYFVHSVEVILARHNLSKKDVDLFIPHQANARMLQQVAKRLDVDIDRFMLTIERYGNVSSASSAIALAEAVATGRIKPGDLVCFTVFGGGLTWGSALIQF